MNKLQYNVFQNKTELNTQFCEEIIRILRLAIAERGEAYLVVSGGKAPRDYLSLLAEAPLDWQKVTVLLADERCVDTSHPDSNENFIRQYLLQGLAAKARFVSLVSAHEEKGTGHEEKGVGKGEEVGESIEVGDSIGEDTGEENGRLFVKRAALLSQQINAMPLFDAVVLGMGEDGHTASLFPFSPEIHAGLSDAATEAVLVINPVTAPYQRLTLTKRRLLKSRHLFLYLTGEEKRKVLNKALEGDDPIEMPIRAFLNAHHPEMHIRFAPNLP